MTAFHNKTKVMKQLTLIAALFFSISSFACGNEYGYSLDGERVFTPYFYLSKNYRSFDKNRIRKRITELRKQADQTNFKTQSDIALNLMKLGHADSALMILEPLIEKYPTEYIINANLGTAYELNGKLEKALKYISEGHRINPESHLGSEWIHIKILEAKIKDKQQPGWIKNNPIVSVEDVHKSVGPRRRHQHRLNHLQLQIRTRVPFTPAPNKVIANLLRTLAEYSAKHDSYENALLAYTYLMEFDPSSKRRVSGEVRALNAKRRESGIQELPFVFKRLMERSEIDPELLLLGIDGIASELNEEHEHRIAYMDSLDNLEATIDSLEALNSSSKENQTSVKTAQNSSGGSLPIILGLLGLVLGIGGTTYFLKRKVQ
jgi:tetratricopeptide (TPR) repeat protein